ncbi:hypothetical protein HKX48_006950 [Thoreauomyces humboldtii]|nr:hypothetical protein HKX48_006950 [Thoreauomyces humboldtii]
MPSHQRPISSGITLAAASPAAGHSFENHANFIRSYAERTRYAASLPGPQETKAAFGALPLPFYSRGGGLPATGGSDLKWYMSFLYLDGTHLPVESGCVQEAHTSLEIAVLRIANLIRNTPGWASLLNDDGAVSRWRLEAERAGLGTPLLRTSSQPDPRSLLYLAECGPFQKGVAQGPLVEVLDGTLADVDEGEGKAPTNARRHYVPLHRLPSGRHMSVADLERLIDEARYNKEPTAEKYRQEGRSIVVNASDVEKMRQRALDIAATEIAEDLRKRSNTMTDALAMSEDQPKTTLEEMFRYALEECMEDAKNAPTRFGTYAVHCADGLIPFETQISIKSEARAILASKPDGQAYRRPRDLYNDARDWIPQFDTVVDLVHPSHLALISGLTRGYKREESVGKTWNDFTSTIGGSSQEAVALPSVLKQRFFWRTRSDKFQWLPAEFYIEPGSHIACFSSYVNNLDPRHYDSIAGVLGQLVPLFENVLTDLQRPRSPRIDYQRVDRYRLPKGASSERIAAHHGLLKLDCCWERPEWEDLALNFPTLPPYKPEDASCDEFPRMSLRGRQLQVIIKSTTVLLTPSKPQHPLGTWHVEGLEHERVVAVGLYCVEVDNVSIPAVSLRTAVAQPGRWELEFEAMMAGFGILDRDKSNQHLADINLLPGRCVVFPNIYQHRFSALSLVDPARDGCSTLLSFLLVDPTSRITSTLQVPPQQPGWLDSNDVSNRRDDDALLQQQTEERLNLAGGLYMFEETVDLDGTG